MEMNQPYVFIDFEFTMPEGKMKTNGFFPEIIEVGAILVVNNEIQKQFSAFVKPNKYPILSERCKNFLKISQQNIDEGISFEDFVLAISEFEGDKPSVVVTWGNMDMKVLRHNCQQAGVEFPFKGKFVDLSMEYKRFFGDQNQTGLWKAVQEYGKEGVGRHHRALDDAMTTYHIFKLVEKDKQYLEKHQPTTIGDRIDLSKVLSKLAF
ncbi:3'-5' exonuclease KapD [Peribacillus tepidiphilus]|uniref:3'-5' exonuclease KapD n=1 Tax=Peribacillus tepidiphilus TaxID=2652445 RepID=UPI0035B50904